MAFPAVLYSTPIRVGGEFDRHSTTSSTGAAVVDEDVNEDDLGGEREANRTGSGESLSRNPLIGLSLFCLFLFPLRGQFH